MTEERKISISKTLCYLLRHHPERIHLDMDLHGGYVKIDQLLNHLQKYYKIKLTMEELFEIVNTDDKQRFAFKDDTIKCCQGHSIKGLIPEIIKVGKDFTPKILYHGTTQEAYYGHIIDSGKISKMQRHHVHLSGDIKTAFKVASRRKKDFVILFVNVHQMMEDGYDLFVSENNVYLVDEVPTKYIIEVHNHKYYKKEKE